MDRLTAAAIAAEVIGEPVTITPRQAEHAPTVWRALQAGTGVRVTDGTRVRPLRFGPGHIVTYPGGDTYPTQDNADTTAALTAHYAHLVETR